MNGRALAIASGLLVTATSTALVGTATAAAIGVSDPSGPAGGARHLAAASRVAASGRSGIDPALEAHNDAVARARFAAAVDTLNAQVMIDAAAAQRARATTRPRTSSGYSGDVLECIKHRESRGQYDVVNSSSGAAGAYQFMPGTWDNTARAGGRTDLVGVNPANASPADQDAMAHQLMNTQGLGPWGGSCG
ncbi:MAG: transglycosylase family protein [Acidimicrobiia bacterium]